METIDRPRFLGASTERVKRLQRSLSRKKKGSKKRKGEDIASKGLEESELAKR